MSKYEFVSISEPLDVGTRIHFDDCTNNVYFVDLPNSVVYRYDLKNKITTKAKVGNEPLGFMFPVAGSNNKFIASLTRKLVFVEWDGVSPEVSKIEPITEVETDMKDNRFNGGKIDPWGRLWAGTMGPADDKGETIPNRGALYSLEKGKLKKKLSNIGISNGLAWDTKNMKMYYVDTLQPKVFQYDISENGEISNEKVVFEFNSNGIDGKPDGLTIDKDGNLWVTAIFGSVIVKFNPNNGNMLDKIVFDTPQPTSIAFGGKNLDEMFVTTARIPVGNVIPPSPAGTTYIIKNTGTTGFKGDRYKE
ncbi:regucalcin-like isoform X1 [Diorhabda carinulata]|uniref:regucalcin-like isoform X1 n=2 Tax=Diorhabda carinulata TaxID=1163345 RepID=UPI0025A17EAA|nr:regucalcin-like isoform X1 [Diorhabda carinulata]